ncbi:MAG: hypothetical protein V4754_05295 [Pseudomonadota bacterium]
MTAKATKQSSKEEQWQQRLARFAASVQRVKQFCQAEAVSATSFYRWSTLLTKGARTAQAAGFIGWIYPRFNPSGGGAKTGSESVSS